MTRLTSTGLAARLRDGEIGAVDATEVYLERIERLDDRIRAYVTVSADLALEQARAADEALARGATLGPLHGLPVALKDNIDTAGVRTTIGSAFFADRVPDRDAEVARRLCEAGAVLLGKVAMHEFAYGGTTQNPHHGLCRNPWDLDRIPGGSSGGSGAAVGGELCAAALGTDTGGSVRIPAALNGLSGLRPTTGGISIRGVFPITWTLDTVGPMAHAVEDVALLYSVLAGYDPGDPLSVRAPAEEPSATGSLRIGVPTNFFFDDLDEGVETAVRAAADVLAGAGATVEEIDVPGAERSHEVASLMIWPEAYSIHRERLQTQPELFGEDVRRRLPFADPVHGTDYAEARQWAREWSRLLEGIFERVDVVLAPVTAMTAPLAADCETIETTRRLTRLTYAWALAGIPCLALPCGLVDGLPVGFQLAAAPFREATLFRAGAEYQRATDWHLRRPALAEVEGVSR